LGFVSVNVNKQILQLVRDPSFDNIFPNKLIKALGERNGSDYLNTLALMSAQIKLLLKDDVIGKVDHDYVKMQHPHKPSLTKTAISLNKRYINYKQQLLLNMGEAEEYKKLCVEYPELQFELQSKYNSVREKNTKILGNIKAIESLLNNKST